MTPRTTHRLRYVIGAALAAATLYASIVAIDWPTVAAAFERASISWIALAVASVLLTLVVVTVRWKSLVGRQRSEWRSLWDAVVLGQAVNIVAPLRFGEGARILLTSRGLDIEVGRVIVALGVERVFDLAAFAAAVLLLIGVGLMPNAFVHVVPMALALVLATTAAVVAFARWLPAVVGWLRRRVRIPARAAEWLDVQAEAVRSGWLDVTSGSRLIAPAALTAILLALAASTNLLVMIAFDLRLPAVTALVLLLVLQAGTAVVSVPGNIGVFHYLTIVTLAAWQVPRPTALAFAIVLHLVTLGPKVLLGALVMVTARATTKMSLTEPSAP